MKVEDRLAVCKNNLHFNSFQSNQIFGENHNVMRVSLHHGSNP